MAHTTFPSDLPVPMDDGACGHLTEMEIPASISLPICTDLSTTINPATLTELTIIFIYPRTGAPDETVPESWNVIPGARGCTPQACSFRDRLPEMRSLGVSRLYGLSTQSSEYQREVHDRLHLPYELLSDEKLELVQALDLPTFTYQGQTVAKRITLAIDKGRVVKWWYPVFPPDKNVDDVIDWLRKRRED